MECVLTARLPETPKLNDFDVHDVISNIAICLTKVLTDKSALQLTQIGCPHQ